MSFQQGLSGLNVAAKTLDVVGNNIANANAAGFKASGAQFSDVFANSLLAGGANSVGIGAQIAAVAPQFTQGNISVTNNSLDIAINGKGFFRLDDNGTITYSRNGQFHLDKSGYIVNNAGLRLTGYGADTSGNIVPSAPVDLRVVTTDLPPLTTSLVNTVLTLDSRETVPVAGVFDPADPTSYTNSTSVSIFDSLGNSHVLSLYFAKTAGPNAWTVHATVDGTTQANVDLGGGAGVAVPLAFDTTGALTTAMPLSVSVDLGAVASDLGIVNGSTTPLAFTVDFTGSTQFGSPFGVNFLDQNGYTSGRLTGISIGADGMMEGRYSNGQAWNLGQLVLANFNNPQGLKPLGGNQWAETPDSGVPLVGAPGTGNLGVVQAGAVEESNVDLTAELVNMITMQRVYQANAQSIKTQDQVLQTIVNLR